MTSFSETLLTPSADLAKSLKESKRRSSSRRSLLATSRNPWLIVARLSNAETSVLVNWRCKSPGLQM